MRCIYDEIHKKILELGNNRNKNHVGTGAESAKGTQ